ncbi:hypothetical protein BB560_002091 [Smittium megazygosporum]|uniref:CBS domain-containing protein n=1 Tax=Smittium megazygosporum TaxID=133381 RepID=A0A2T9Z721_9FUNG|nr:hypothetical protein BB560_005232 [Smittium megazygosporum]PVV03419.1 hypothetical protein BB560_002091 [Smittium megazygosporum]
MSQLARSRIAKKDEAIRKKAELNIEKKQTPGKKGSVVSGFGGSWYGKAGSTVGASSSKNVNAENTITEFHNGKLYLDGKLVKPGTVADLQPNIAFTANENITIVDAAKLMAAKRADCVLVIDREDRLAGIFTAKDIAFRVVAEGKNIYSTIIKDIATPDPFCVVSEASAIDALNTMVEKQFRHLPICNEEGDVIGLLDVLKCMYDALDKMDRTYQTTQNLYTAFEGVQRELSVQNEQLFAFIDNLRNKINCPTVESIVTSSEPLVVSPRTSVFEIAQLMKMSNTTAALVIDETTGLISGIFTSKDIILRVIAAELDPLKCSVVRVMTPHPDTISPDTPITAALVQMHEKHYLNLPVVDEDGQILGVADVLSLCYSTLETMKRIHGDEEQSDNDGINGPMWSHFFKGNNYFDSNFDRYSNSIAENNNSVLQQSVLNPPMSFVNDTSHLVGDIYPNDSASMIDQIDPVLRPSLHHNDYVLPPFSQSQEKQLNNNNGANYNAQFPANINQNPGYDHYAVDHSKPDDYNSQGVFTQTINSNNTPHTESIQYTTSIASSNNIFPFKFKTPYGNIHRFNLPTDNYELLHNEIVERLLNDGIQDAETLTLEVGLVYVDSENDLIQLNNVLDLSDAIEQARSENKDRVLVMLNTTPEKIEARKKSKQLKEAEIARKKARETLSAHQIRETITGPLGIPGSIVTPAIFLGGLFISFAFILTANRIAHN